MKGHKGSIDSVEVFGCFLVTCSSADKTVRLWDVRCGNRAVRCFAGLDEGNFATLINDQTLLVLNGGAMTALDMRQGAIVTSAESCTMFREELSNEVLNQVVMASQDTAFVCDDNGCVIKVGNVTGKRTKTVFAERHSSLCTSIALAKDELLSVGTDCAVKQWNMASGKLLKSQMIMVDQQGDAATIANPPHLLSVAVKAKVAAIACGDGRILLWDCAKRKLLPSIKDFHTYSASHVVCACCVVSVFFFLSECLDQSWPTSDLLLSCGNDMKGALWRVDTRKPKSSDLKVPVASFELTGKPNWACSTPASAFFAIGDTVHAHEIK